MSIDTFKNDLYIEKKMKEYFIKKLPQYVLLEDAAKIFLTNVSKKTEDEIREELESILGKKIVDKINEDGWKINWHPNLSFIRPDDLYWMDFHFLTNDPMQIELGTGGRNRWSGFLQINICVPKNEMSLDKSGDESESDIFGSSAMDKCYLDISRVFRRGTIFDGIKIFKTRRYTSAMQVEEDFCWCPVRIMWTADLSN